MRAEESRARAKKALAAELGVSAQVISQAIARARRVGSRRRQLPADTQERLFAVELRAVPPLPADEWERLAALVRGIYVDVTWIAAQPGQLLAEAAEEAAQEGDFDARPPADLLRTLSRTQALAVIDACQSGDLGALPTA
ncbi:hypothetical protein [Streptomyces albidoflavus]|uniref:hypothetical protein n=1 Tax=Streptomyces albidoflavus TaxID=1886 RepID=UPI0033CFFAE6